MRIPIFPVVLIFIFTACNQNNVTTSDSSLFNADSLAKDIAILSSDEFQGRKPFTTGEIKTINYLKDQFSVIGAEPGNGNSYFQEVPMVNIATEPDTIMQVKSPKGSFNLKGFDDYVIWTEKTDSLISLKNDEVIFAGYGVVAPEYNWNDYAGLNVKDKVVIVMVNDPGYGVDSTLFKGDTMTYYGRWTYKFEEAARQGAKACLMIHNTKAASYAFSVPQNNWKGSRLRLDDRNNPQNYCSVVGWIQEAVAKKLLTTAGLDSSILKKANHRGFKGVPLNLTLSTKLKVTATYNKSHNVIAKITGTQHPDEYIIYTAHWDHLGIGKPNEKGDSIYNGAVDNASGTAGLLQLARAFKNSKIKPGRTIIFLAVTAEEQGLWGSAWYARNPVYPLSKTIANINTDGLNKTGKTKDVIVVGRGQSELEDYLEEEAKKQGRYISFETNPAGGSYYRSDHFNFAKVGVPALYAGSGIEVIGKEKGYGKKLKDEYGTNNYHKPSDEYDKTWVLEGAIQDVELIYNLGQRLASIEKWPQWKPGSEFKAIREKNLIVKNSMRTKGNNNF
jgi:Zn-dependent M28 family amino/carboxypeptidase